MAEDQEETYQDRQENELSVLQAMFMDDFQDVNLGEKHGKNVEFRLHLLPTQGTSFNGDVHVTIDLRVSYPPRYPDEIPSLTLENAKGISNDKVKHFKKELDSRAKRLRGEVMIMELAQYIQSFLHSHNVPGFKSFYEEMMSNKKREEEKMAKEQQKQLDFKRKKQEKERKELEEEIQKRQVVLKEETRRRRELAAKQVEDGNPANESEKPSSAPSSPEKTHSTKDRSDTSPAINRRKHHQPDPHIDSSGSEGRTRSRSIGTSKAGRQDTDSTQKKLATRSKSDASVGNQVITTTFNTKAERTINRGKRLGRSHNGSTTYVGMDAKTGELVTIREWVMKWKHGKGRKPLPDEEKAAEDCLKQLTSIEQELLSLLRLDHPNLVHYLAIKHSQGKEATTVELLVEYIGGGSLAQQISGNTPVPLDLLRQYATDLLEVLSYLHGKAVVHKDLSAGSVFLGNDGRLKVADYSLCKRLNDLYETVNAERHSVRFSEEKSYGGRGGKKGDVLQFGILLMCLLEGRTGIDYPCEIPQELPSDLRDFLSRCLDTDERNRSTVQNLQDHPFIKPPVNTTPDGSSTTNSESIAKPVTDADSNDMVLNNIPLSYEFSKGHQRLCQEFEFMEFLGKGGFGNVIKYQNKLDGNLYAIKKILLNPKSKELNKKITREVKLLSRLNHENVVRYYNSWIEVTDTPPTTDESVSESKTTDTSTGTQGAGADAAKVPQDKNSLSVSDDVEKLAPRLSAYGSLSLEWSSLGDTGQSIESSSDDDSDAGVFGASFMPYSDSSSDGIEFEHESGEQESSQSKEKSTSKPNENNDDPNDTTVCNVQYLYIQMEFCDGGTLRHTIDRDLYKDHRRVWRYFREIVEGLVHIHSQGMIHRDLKPVNIFLDSNDLIKIGDFGLATAEQVGTGALSESASLGMLHNDSSHSQSAEGSAGGNMTGKVGTALYVSPELCKAKASHYNQKVDLYSLGVIFFEMCSPSLSTGMERVKILSLLRQESIQLPDDFEVQHESQTKIIKWLLNHDPSKRPTAQELLQSSDLPPPQMEDARLQEMLRQTIANSKSKAYRYLMHELFTQSVPAVADYMYDMDIQKGYSMNTSVIHQIVGESLRRLFQLHGAVQLNTPLILPKGDVYENYDSYYCGMDRSGQLVTLPYDLRVPFARFVARNNITNLKRFSIERVFREKKIHGSHPREMIECAFDIVTTNATSLIPDAEVLHVVSDVINEFPSLQNRNYSIRLNHTLLLTGVLNHCGIAEDKHVEVYQILSQAKTERLTKLQVQTKLCSLSLSEQEVTNLYRYIELEGPYSKVQGELKQLTRGKGPNASIVKQGLHELEAIITQAQVFGIRQEMIITLSLVYNIQCFAGMIFQFVAEPLYRKKKSAMDVLAAGGRYDKLIPQFKRLSSASGQSLPIPSAVGVSVSFEKIVSAILQDDGAMEMLPNVCDILVCAIGSSCSLKDRIKVVRDLWAAGLKADILCDTTLALEEIQEYCKRRGIPHMVLLKDADNVKIRSFERDKISTVESRVMYDKVVEYLQQRINKGDTIDSAMPVSTKPVSVENREVTNYNVTFVMQDKLESSIRRRHDRQIHIRIQHLLECLSPKAIAEVVAMDLPMVVVKSMVAMLDFDGDELYQSSVSALCDKYSRYRKYLVIICDELQELKMEKSVPFVILYSYKEDAFKVIY